MSTTVASDRLSAQTESSIPSTPVTLVVGKGGVGKSTVARALAEWHAQQGASAVRLSVDDTSSVAAPPDRDRDAAGLARDIALPWDEALAQAAADVFGSPRAARALLGNFAMRHLMNVLPGVREYSVLLASYRWRETVDRVVLDMPATGHGLSWIDTVSLAAKIFPNGRVSERAAGLRDALRNPLVTSVVLVTVAEPVVSNESRELRAGLERALGMAPALTVVNRGPREPGTTDEQLAALSQRQPELRADIGALRTWCDDQRRAFAIANDHPAPVVTVPRTTGDPVVEARRVLDRSLAIDVASSDVASSDVAAGARAAGGQEAA